MSALVCFGTLVVEVPDDTYNLADIRELFHAPRGFIRSRKDNRVVATLPFETLPSFDGDEYDFIVETGDNETAMEESNGPGSYDDLLAAVMLQCSQTPTYAANSVPNSTSAVYPPGCYNPYLSQSARLDRWHSSRPYRAAVEPYSLQ